MAEILITLLIIGTIAAVTIPVLINNIQEQQLITAWKSGFSILGSATNNMLADNGGPFAGAAFGTPAQMKDKFKPYFNYIKDCPVPTAGICWASDEKLANGSPGASMEVPGIILNNGMFLRFFIYQPVSGCDDQSTFYNGGECGDFELDVNGFKGPNTWGKDLFLIHISTTGIVPAGTPKSIGQASAANCPNWGYGCSAARLLE